MYEALKSWEGKFAWALFLFFTCWWIYIQFFAGSSAEGQHDLFTSSYGLMALFGGTAGILISKHWGFTKSVMGRAILFFSLGLFAQEFGQLAYTYYIYVLGVEVPYPSLGDLGFFLSIPLYSYAVFLLAKASGIRIGLRSFSNKLQALVIPLLMLSVSYILFLTDYELDWTQPLTVILDFGYPMGQAVYISLAILTYTISRKILGGVMRNKILFILFALFVQYLSDYTFLYQVSREVWAISGINDYMFLVAYFLMTLGLVQMNTELMGLREKETAKGES